MMVKIKRNNGSKEVENHYLGRDLKRMQSDKIDSKFGSTRQGSDKFKHKAHKKDSAESAHLGNKTPETISMINSNLENYEGQLV